MSKGFHGKFSTLVNDKRHTWFIQSLIKATKDLPVIEVPLSKLEKHFNINAWFHGDNKPTLRELISHYQRAEQSDLSYPIIISEEFGLMDGLHRILKAHLSGQTTMLAVTLLETPTPDYVGEF